MDDPGTGVRPGVSEATLAGCGRLRDARDGTSAGGGGCRDGASAEEAPASSRGWAGACGRRRPLPHEDVTSARRKLRVSRRRHDRREDVRLRGGLLPPRSRYVDLVPYRGPKVMSRVCNRGEVVNFTTSSSHPPRRSRHLRDGRPPSCTSRHGRRPSPAPLAVPLESRPSRRRPQPARAAAEMACVPSPSRRSTPHPFPGPLSTNRGRAAPGSCGA
jgi:hypothetical protein